MSVTQFLTKGLPTSRTRHWPVWCRKARTEARVVPWSAAQTQAHCRQQLEARLVTVTKLSVSAMVLRERWQESCEGRPAQEMLVAVGPGRERGLAARRTGQLVPVEIPTVLQSEMVISVLQAVSGTWNLKVCLPPLVTLNRVLMSW